MGEPTGTTQPELAELALWARLAGLELDAERLAALGRAYERLAAQMAPLQALDLDGVEPAVVFRVRRDPLP